VRQPSIRRTRGAQGQHTPPQRAAQALHPHQAPQADRHTQPPSAPPPPGPYGWGTHERRTGWPVAGRQRRPGCAVLLPKEIQGAVSVAAAPANSVAGIALGADRVQEA